jgi:hypothetical protein
MLARHCDYLHNGAANRAPDGKPRPRPFLSLLPHPPKCHRPEPQSPQNLRFDGLVLLQSIQVVWRRALLSENRFLSRNGAEFLLRTAQDTR